MLEYGRDQLLDRLRRRRSVIGSQSSQERLFVAFEHDRATNLGVRPRDLQTPPSAANWRTILANFLTAFPIASASMPSSCSATIRLMSPAFAAFFSVDRTRAAACPAFISARSASDIAATIARRASRIFKRHGAGVFIGVGDLAIVLQGHISGSWRGEYAAGDSSRSSVAGELPRLAGVVNPRENSADFARAGAFGSRRWPPVDAKKWPRGRRGWPLQPRATPPFPFTGFHKLTTMDARCLGAQASPRLQTRGQDDDHIRLLPRQHGAPARRGRIARRATAAD